MPELRAIAASLAAAPATEIAVHARGAIQSSARSITDNNGKLTLLYDLERVTALLRDGGEPFHPDRDRLAFARLLIDAGCQPPSANDRPGRAANDQR
jgi:hypothetical protein